MPDVLDFVPVFAETLARVRARMDADANAGLATDDPGWVDTREGSFYWDMTQVAALEIARLWDALGAEAVAAAFPATAWGEYLDMHGATFDLPRNPAVAATVTVLFIGEPGTLVATNTRVSAIPSDPSLDTITFATTDSGAIADGLAIPAGVTVVGADSGGHLPAATYIYHVTAYNIFGETLGSPDHAATITTSAGEVTVSWGAVTGAVGYRVYRTLTVGTLGQLVADVTGTSFADTGDVPLGALEPTVDTTPGLLLPAVSLRAGTDGNLAARAITSLDTVIPRIVSATNPEPAADGEDVESDDSYRLRILSQYKGQGGGNQQDFVKWSLDYGVPRALCVPVWAGPQTVLVVPMELDGSPVSPAMESGLQAYLNPAPATGAGRAPIGAIVTVTTTTALGIDIVAVLTFAAGYSLDGTSGSIPTRTEIVTELAAYLATLDPGETVGYQQTLATFFRVDGIVSVGSLTVNGGTADVVLGLSPPQYPRLNTPTLT